MSPGSPEAVAKGCTCPITDNAHGLGVPGADGNYWITDDCPIHGRKEEEEDEE